MAPAPAFAKRRVNVNVGQPRARPEDSDPRHGLGRRCAGGVRAELSQTRHVPTVQQPRVEIAQGLNRLVLGGATWYGHSAGGDDDRKLSRSPRGLTPPESSRRVGELSFECPLPKSFKCDVEHRDHKDSDGACRQHAAEYRRADAAAGDFRSTRCPYQWRQSDDKCD
jgi:hypothetical protein